MRRLAILQEIYAIEQWAAADDVGMQALHIVATHAEDGYGLASSTRRSSLVADNEITICGNLTREPELRFTSGGTATCGFGVP